jgi:acetyl esterase
LHAYAQSPPLRRSEHGKLIGETNGRRGNRQRVVGRTYLERGEPVVVVARWGGDGPRNVLVRRSDGSLVVRPFRGLRRAPDLVADSN